MPCSANADGGRAERAEEGEREGGTETTERAGQVPKVQRRATQHPTEGIRLGQGACGRCSYAPGLLCWGPFRFLGLRKNNSDVRGVWACVVRRPVARGPLANRANLKTQPLAFLEAGEEVPRSATCVLQNMIEPIAQPILFPFQVVLALKPHPELCGVSEEAREQ